MGLFVNRQKVCPICNRPTPRIFPTEIESMPICRECAGKIDLPDGMTDQMSLESFRRYLKFYDENKALRDIFTESFRVDFGALNSHIVLDTANRLFRLKRLAASLVMEASNLKSFRILEDNVPLFDGEGDTLRFHSSKVPDLVKGVAPRIAQFFMRQEMYAQLGHMEREGSDSGPGFEMSVPFKHFYVELVLTHPYWRGFRGKLDAPCFNRYHPSVDTYMQDYHEKVDRLHTLALKLMWLIDPDAQEIYDESYVSSSQSVSVEDAINEIQRYETLLNSGIITGEEFTAKKRQLLGR